ncbi:MAG TPA: hypothetical protein ENL18_02240, partial [Thermoplasmatales archaeon]|nr:hypothetical protein [Thermoplasmatales archaeon]
MDMKVKFAVFAAFLMFMGSISIAGVNDTGNETATGEKSGFVIPMHFSFSLPSEYEKENFSVIDVGGADEAISMPSRPSMPYKSEVLTFPLGTKIDGIEVSTGDVNTMHLDRKIIPASEPVRADMSNTVAERKEGKIYLSNEPYPSNWVEWNTGAGLENGKHVVFLSIHAFPARYTPAANEL